MFPQDPGIAQPVSFIHGDVSIAADTRDHPGHPTAGGLYRAAFAAYSDRDLSQFSFRRYEAEAAQFIPVAGPRWVLAAHGWGVFSDTRAGDSVPFYMLPSLGGSDTLRGYYDYRFHDRNLLVANLESRFALLRNVDAAVFFDAGNVAARAGDLNLDKTSYGAGLRLHARATTIGRLDVGRSRDEGWRVFLKLDDPLRLKRLLRRTATIPFVP
jgi:outer membrane protein assembly factor BamA